MSWAPFVRRAMTWHSREPCGMFAVSLAVRSRDGDVRSPRLRDRERVQM